MYSFGRANVQPHSFFSISVCGSHTLSSSLARTAAPSLILSLLLPLTLPLSHTHTHTLLKEARGWGFSLCADVDRCEIPIVTSAHLSSAAVQLHNCVYTREKRSRVPAGDSSEAKEEVSECADVTFVLACVCALSLPLSNKHVWPTQKGT